MIITLSNGSNECIQSGRKSQFLIRVGSHSGFLDCKILINKTINRIIAIGTRIPNNTPSPAIDQPKIIVLFGRFDHTYEN